MIRALLRLVRAVVGCNHAGDVYRERRPLKHHPDLQVQHFVCADCGAAWPVLRRSAAEHTRMVERGAVRPLVSRQQPPESKPAKVRAGSFGGRA
jgi:hypothetical protein